ncbi:Os04g0447566, partial [Oryza sativa Japonica Group]
MPLASQYSLTVLCCQVGFISTCRSMHRPGIYAVYDLSMCLVVKLLTPMALARPSRWHSSIARHTPPKSNGTTSSFFTGNTIGPGLTLIGKWIRYRSTYSICRLSRRDGSTRSGWHWVHHSLVVTNASSRDARRPRRVASAMASPSGASVRYREAVSKWRKPASSAASTASLVLSGVLGYSATPIPTAGMGLASPCLRTASGTTTAMALPPA